MNLNIALAVAPALVLLWLFKKWDEKRPEPPGKIRWVVALGALTCIPAAIIELMLEAALGPAVVDAQGGLVKAFLVAATVEEGLKLMVIFLYVWSKPHFDEVMDGILYVAASSLGFALLENILYSAGNPIIGLMRAFTAVPMHAICSGIMGYYIGRAKLARSGRLGWIAIGLAFGIGIHGLYDWMLFSGGTFGFAPPDPWLGLAEVLPLLIVCGALLYVLVKSAHRIDDQIHGAHARPLPVAQPAAVGYYPHPMVAHPGHAWHPAGHPGHGASPPQGAYPPHGAYHPHAYPPHGAFPQQGAHPPPGPHPPYVAPGLGHPGQGYPPPAPGPPGHAAPPGYLQPGPSPSGADPAMGPPGLPHAALPPGGFPPNRGGGFGQA